MVTPRFDTQGLVFSVIYTKRLERENTTAIGGIFFEGTIAKPTLLLELDDESSIKFGTAFIADAIEFYLEHIITLGAKDAIKKGKVTKNHKS